MASPDTVDERITSFVKLYADQSGHIKVSEDDPVLHPDILTTLDTQTNQILVTCDATGKKTAIPFSDIIQIDLMAYYQYQQIHETAFDGEGQITSAIRYVTSDTAAAVPCTGIRKQPCPPRSLTPWISQAWKPRS